MSDPQLFKQIIDYLDNLHRDIGQMVSVIEQGMADHGYQSPMGGRASLDISSHFARPDGWRIPYVYRLYSSVDEEKSTNSPFFLVLLESKTAFDFPPIICGHVTHPPFSKEEIVSLVYWNIHVRSLARRRANWTQLREVNSWFVSERPRHDTKVESVQGYILNLFDMVNRQCAHDNIIRPLLNPGNNLEKLLTVPKYAFPQYLEKD